MVNFADDSNFFGALVPKSEHFSNALYTFDIGQNDLTAGYSHQMTVDQVKEFVPEVLAQFKTIIKVNLCFSIP